MKERERLLKEIEELKRQKAGFENTWVESRREAKECDVKLIGLEAALEQLGDEDVDALFEKFEKFTPEQKELFFDKIGVQIVSFKNLFV